MNNSTVPTPPAGSAVSKLSLLGEKVFTTLLYYPDARKLAGARALIHRERASTCVRAPSSTCARALGCTCASACTTSLALARVRVRACACVHACVLERVRVRACAFVHACVLERVRVRVARACMRAFLSA
eukprot:6177204-Pleurochrysis_carterae.AAC.1